MKIHLLLIVLHCDSKVWELYCPHIQKKIDETPYQTSQSSQYSIGHTQVTRQYTFYFFIAMIGVNISRKPLEIIFLAIVFFTFTNIQDYGVLAQSKICTSYQCFLGLTNANQLDAVSLNN